MYVIFCGVDNWINYNFVEHFINITDKEHHILVGNENNFDHKIQNILKNKRNDLDVTIFNTEINKYGNSAKPRRIMSMIDMKPDLAMVFDDETSRELLYIKSALKKRSIDTSRIDISWYDVMNRAMNYRNKKYF